MVVRLNRWDEVWAEINDLPSPYARAVSELCRLQRQHVADCMRDALAGLKHISMSFVVSPTEGTGPK